jgi:hypothetical protein
MGYSQILVPEIPLRLGGDVVLVNALHNNAYLHRHEHEAAYLDGDRRFRISSYAALTRPRAAYQELLMLGSGRWTEREVAEAIIGANLGLRRALGAA